MPNDGRIVYEVKCPCGGIVKVDARGFGTPLGCPACEGSLVVAWGRDARNTETIPVIVRHVPGKKRPVLAGPKGPTLKTQILPQARFFDCVCGVRNVLIGVGPGKSVDCSGCDRVHLLEAAPVEAAKPAPAAAPPKAVVPPPPPEPARKLKLGEILCQCGEILPPRTSKTGREFECKACGRKGHVVPGQEANGTPRIDTVFTSEPAPRKPPPPPAAEAQGREAACPCGAELLVSESLAGRTVACDACSRELEVVAKNGHVRLRER